MGEARRRSEVEKAAALERAKQELPGLRAELVSVARSLNAATGDESWYWQQFDYCAQLEGLIDRLENTIGEES